MALSPEMQNAVSVLDASLARVQAKAAREARFDIRQGSTFSYQDARDNARDAKTVGDQHYWKSYAAELIRQGKR